MVLFRVVFVIMFQKFAFLVGVFGAYIASMLVFVFSGHSIEKLMALPGMYFIFFRFITMVIPFVRGLSLSYICMKFRLGPYLEFRLSSCESFEWDSRVHRMASFFDRVVCTMAFHFSCVAELLAPLTFRDAIVMNPALGGGLGAPPRCNDWFPP